MTKVNRVLSIIIASHNSGANVQKTLDSLLKPLGDKIVYTEIIIIDDSSSDESSIIFKQFEAKVEQAHCYRVEYRNIGKVRNYAVLKCQNDYITMLDSDDLLKENALNDIICFLMENNVDLLLTKLHEVRDISLENVKWKGLQPKKLLREDAIKRFIIHKDFQGHLIGQFIKREILTKCSIPDFTCYEDLYTFPDVLMVSNEIIYSQHSHYLYIKNNNSLSNIMSGDKVEKLFLCIKRMEDIFPNKYRELIACHWIDFYLKRRKWLSNLQIQHELDNILSRVYSFGFFLNPNVRFSYKKKAIRLLWKK
ncbi:glycosyltransferase [Klebsiella variicola]|uniref:glycosyltransferase n=2 Tax=Klebsiella pneumoniae complex TaxID=3390273 RepID=UPI001CDAEBEF|nr:glycosyltransferase [Klebsiella variicola]